MANTLEERSPVIPMKADPVFSKDSGFENRLDPKHSRGSKYNSNKIDFTVPEGTKFNTKEPAPSNSTDMNKIDPAPTKGSGFNPMNVGGAGLSEAFNESLKFQDVLQSDLLVAITKILNQITQRGLDISSKMQSDLAAILNEMKKASGDDLTKLQAKYTTLHDFWTNLQTENGSQRDRYTSLENNVDQEFANGIQGLSFFNNIYSTLAHLIA